MMNGNSGIADVATLGGGTTAVVRRDAQPQSSSDSFGDALKGQMDKVGNTQDSTHQSAQQKSSAGSGNSDGSSSQQAENKANNDGGGKTDNSAASTKSAQDSPTSSDTDAKRTKKDDKGKTADNAQIDGLPVTAITTAADTKAAAATQSANGTDGVTDGKIAAGSGKELPQVLALVAGKGDPVARKVDTTPTAQTADLPDWIESMGEQLAGSEGGAVTDGKPGSGKSGTSTLSTLSQATSTADRGLLKELQAMATGAAGKDAKDGTGTGGKGTGSDALLKIIAGTVPKDSAATFQPQTTSAVASTNLAAPATVQTTAQSAATQLSVDVPVNQPGWDHAVSERVVWMAQQGIQQATIQLHPKNMGPIDIHIALHKDDANVTFVAHHPGTRDALEAAMPKLRDMMQQSGLNLVQSDVSHQSFGQQGQQASGGGNGGQHGGTTQDATLDNAGAAALSGELPLHGGALGAVDYYA